MSHTTTTVLGKRTTRATPATLLLQLSASDSNRELSDVSWQELGSDVELPQTPLRPRQKSEFVLVNGSLVKNAKKKYHCTFSGCKKSYTKPCRLEEHERSHTGEVSFVFFRAERLKMAVDRSGPSYAQLAINHICERLTSKLMLVLIYLIPIDRLSVWKKVVRRGFGQCNI